MTYIFVSLSTRTPPSNCRFECDDINLGLGHYANSFNVVHCRLIALGLTNYRAFLGEVAEMLRPGGVYLSMEPTWSLRNENFEVCTSDDENEPVRTYAFSVTLLATP